MNRVVELLESEKLEEIQSAIDTDAKMGYKSEENSFFGYKTHIAMTEERIITGIEVTSGEAPEGEYLQSLIEQSEENGIKVKEVNGDMAFSGKKNLEYTEEKCIRLISKLNPVISNGNGQKAKGFEYNKDADMYQCPCGHLAVQKTLRSRKKEKGKNSTMMYYFDIKKCEVCPKREGCYKDGAKYKTYSVSIMSETHKKQQQFQETSYFKKQAKERYMIEAKNAEMKQAHGLEKADSVGVIAMRLQSYFTAFVVNAKRMVKLAQIQMA
jgi:hypothetical protein